MMHLFLKTIGNRARLPGRQKGAYTMFSAVLILILLTEMIIYAAQTGVFEQRKSANEMRQKEAFHIADSAIQFGKEFMLANTIFVASAADNILPKGGEDGWLSKTSPRWLPCAEVKADYESDSEHPCNAEPADEVAFNAGEVPVNLRDSMYFYGDDRATPNWQPLPIDVSGVLADSTQQVAVYALLCMLDIERDPLLQVAVPDSIVQGCTTVALPDADNLDQPGDTRYYMVTLVARGEADCDGGTCTAKALITDKIGSFGPGGGDGGGGVPLTTRSNFPPTGSAEIVPNPNGGGVGVPISAWMNTNPSCPDQVIVDAEEGSWATCERHEWYGVDQMTADFKCPGRNCACSKKEKRLSWSDGNKLNIGIDLVEDDNFPCDLFYYTFGVYKDAAGIDFVKYGLAKEVLDDCSTLDENSFGVYWVSGSMCKVAANTQIGSADAPVFLISAASITRFNGGASLFGTLFVTDAEDPAAKFDAVGTMTIYGAAIIDAELAKYQGTFQVVYIDSILKKVLQTGGFGAVAGGWSDFHPDWQ